MVMTKSPDSVISGHNHKYLDVDKINKSLDKVTTDGAAYAEVRLVAYTDYSATIRDRKLERAIPGQEIGATIRVLADGAWGVHSTTDIASLEQQMGPTLKLAQSVAARRSSNDRPISLAEVPIIEDSLHWKPKKDVRNTDLADRLELMNLLSDSASGHENVVSVTCGWHDEHIHTEFLSSEGMNRTWSFQRSLINGMVTARDGSDVVSYRTRFGGEGGLELIESCDINQLGIDAKTSALRLLKAERAPSGKLPLIADRDLTGVYIHEALGHPCEADLVAAGDSCLDGKLGQKIGSDIVTVIDDPTIRGGYGSHPIDDEGLDTTEKLLIKNGVLTEYLNHRETAAHFDIKPNAGARAQDGLHHPLVRMSNTLIHGGTHTDLDELVEDLEYGVYACGSRGGQVDTGRGSFQFAAQEAWLIENGEITAPLKDVSVSGLTLQILNNVDGLTKESKLAAPGFCGKGQTVPVGDGGPIMRISEALVG
ncbi:MAG TPA: TldD/PmbA family protein [Candidatus Poseidoniaceae archaeon]|nr:MAG TPA: TldD/PmbA family protein [Candidatus Poseidoniales archaeon]HII36924.1 TldD/PmbA family protein [Candidatus Poseidoniaceae archaeon]|tara:strand:+ start:212 stop:1654 length:1443 start_codon:yes stop_codon:yes gene_type:complete